MVIFRFPLTPSPPKKRCVLDNAVSKLIFKVRFLNKTEWCLFLQPRSTWLTKNHQNSRTPRNFQRYTLFPFTQNKRLDFGKTDFNQESGNKKKFQENLIL